MNIEFKVKLAINEHVVASFGHKPDLGQGLRYQEKSEHQRMTAYRLTKKFKNVELTIDEIAYKVINRGFTITAQHGGHGIDCKGPNCNKKHSGPHRLKVNFIGGQHLGQDFDTLTSPSEVLEHPLVKLYGTIVYFTVSSTPEKPKMRVIFILSEAIYDRFLYERLQAALMWKFGQLADKSVKDCLRLFYGRLDTQPTIFPDKVMPLVVALQILEEFEAENPHEKVKAHAKYRAEKVGKQQGYTGELDNVTVRTSRFARAALRKAERELKAVDQAGKYYEPLNRWAYLLGRLIGGRELAVNEAVKVLGRAIENWPAGAGGSDKDRTIEVGIKDGKTNPLNALVRGREILSDLKPLTPDVLFEGNFLPDFELVKRVTAILWPKGGGKTEWVARLLARNPFANVLSIVPRISLSLEQAQRLGLENYLDKDNPAELNATRQLIICLDSIFKLYGESLKPDIVILDEFATLLKHLAGETCKKERRKIMRALTTVLENARYIICLDADLGETALETLEKFAGGRNNIQVIGQATQRTKPSKAPIFWHRDNGSALAKVFEAIDQGLPAFVPCLKKAAAKALYATLKERYPDKRIMAIHEETAAEEEVQTVLTDMNKGTLELDVLIASPTILTGVDISNRHFKRTIFFAEHIGAKLSHIGIDYRQALQLMGRNRHPEEIHIYTEPTWGESSEILNFEHFARMENARIARGVSELAYIYQEQTFERIAHPDELDYLELKTRLQADFAFSEQNFGGLLLAQAEAEGHQIIDLGEKDLPSEQEIAERKAEDKQARAKVKEDEIKEVVEAEPIDKPTYDALSKKRRLTPGQRASIKKFEIGDFYNVPDKNIGEWLVRLDNEGQFRPALHAYQLLQGKYLNSKEEDEATLNEGYKMLGDITFHHSKTKARRKLLLAAGLIDENNQVNPAWSGTSKTLDAFVKAALAEAKFYEEVLGLKFTGKALKDKTIRVLTGIAGQVGIKLNAGQQQVSGVREWVYTVDSEQLEALRTLDIRRAVKLIAKHKSKMHSKNNTLNTIDSTMHFKPTEAAA